MTEASLCVKKKDNEKVLAIAAAMVSFHRTRSQYERQPKIKTKGKSITLYIHTHYYEPQSFERKKSEQASMLFEKKKQ